MRVKRTDKEHAAVGRALKRLGYVYKSLHTQGGGVEDYLVGVVSRVRHSVMTRFWVLLEVKTAQNKRREATPSQYTPAQLKWHELTEGWPRIVAMDAQDAIDQLREMETL